MKKKEWFASWFDTPFYHILYNNRDFDEAERFINFLLKELSPSPNASMLDLACGKGRHAYYIAKKGFQVTGVDLSPQSIASAKNHFRLDNLNFEVHDMREKFEQKHFDYVFNFFTSFGYFDNFEDNKRVIHAMSESLNPGGTLVIDFLNVKKAIADLIEVETKQASRITFVIKKKLDNGIIVKDISFTDEGKAYNYQEKVQALNLADFELLISDTDLNLVKTYGSYQLDEFDEENSDRLIMLFKKD